VTVEEDGSPQARNQVFFEKPAFWEWTTAPRPPAGGVAFDATGAAADEVPVWRADLPADPNLATRRLDDAEEGLGASRAALTAAAERIDALVQEQEDRPTGLAFAVTAAEAELAQPERELMALLRGAERGEPVVSFEAGEAVSGGWRQVTQQFQGFVDQLLRVVAHYAWVETHVQGRLLAQTTVGWTGDTRTVWQEEMDPTQMALHQRTLTLALSSRETLIRTFVVAASGAAKLSMLLTTPVGAMLALPAAWKFINQVRAEIEKHQQIKKEV
jgi:hypothetical protein